MLSRLAQAGYHAVAPAMRGYGSTGPAPDGCYQPWATGADAVAIMDALGQDKAYLIGHDWGAGAAYAAAALHPTRVERLVALSVPYGMGEAIITDGDQQRRSWYWFFFQLPFAEAAVAHNDFAFIDRLWAEWSPGYAHPSDARRALKSMFSMPGVLQQTLEYYRQMFQPPEPRWAAAATKIGAPIQVPTLYLHGRDDGCIGAYLSEGMEHRFSGGLRRVVIDGAGHFLHVERPDLVADLIVEFLAARTPEPAT
jgi:pimeloyl-ACP methyl ester carboxylesterase